MADIGRNDPCPCGSGRKFKKCHGSMKNNNPTHVPSTTHVPLSVSMEADSATPRFTFDYLAQGLPGHRFIITVVPQRADRPITHRDNPQGSPGSYKAISVLHRPGHSLESPNDMNAAELLNGESYLKIIPSQYVNISAGIIGASPILHASVRCNDKGFVEKIETDPFPAQSLEEARKFAFRLLAPMLGHWCIECNLPISIYRTDVIELSTETRSTDIVAPFPELDYVPSIQTPLQMSIRFRACISLYREAINSNSPAYTFLCLYRILEGFIEDRKKKGIESKERGTPPPNYRVWMVPSTEPQFIAWLNSLYRIRLNWDGAHCGGMFPSTARGKRITKIIDDLYDLRCRIAHSIVGGNQENYWEESLDYFNEIDTWLPLIQMIVRRMIKDEHPTEFLVGIPDTGLESLCKGTNLE
jgi:hypothetical protein